MNLVCCSPTLAVTWFDKMTTDEKLPRIEVAGGKLTVPLMRKLLGIFDELHDVYGASETNKSFTNVTTLSPEGLIERRGLPIETTKIEIIDGKGTPCDPSKIGAVRIRNDYMATGYLDAPEATARAFRDGWFYPGDVASWGDNGELIIYGRDDHVINLGGSKVDAFLIDMTMQQVPGVTDAVCFKNPKDGALNELLAFVEYSDNCNPAEVEMQLRDFCNETLGFFLTPRRFHAINKVPRSNAGHPKRLECERLILNAIEKKKK